MKRPLLVAIAFLLAILTRAQTSYTWNGSISTSWTTAGNWTPNGIPGAADNVTIVTGSNICQVSGSPTISNFTLTSGTIDLGGGTFTIAGATVNFAKGTVQNGSLSITGATTTTIGSSPVTMNCTVTVSSAAVTMKNTTFQQATTITKTGATNDGSSGNNIFNGAATFNNAGTGYLMLGNGNPDQFNSTSTFNNTGGANIYVAYNSSGNTFGGVATFNNTPTASSAILVASYSAGTMFNNNVVVTSNNGQGVLFCTGNSSATATLAASYTVSIGSGGFSAGSLTLRQFTQTGATAQNLSLTGTGDLILGPSSTFGGAVTATIPALNLNGATFNGIVNLTKTGATGDWSNGGNIFNAACTITNSGSSYVVLGNSSPDIWNSDVTFTDNGSERLLPCWTTAGNQFNGNIYINSSGSAQGVQFCGGNSTATATQAAGMTIQAGSGGITAGYLYLKQFTQNGTTPINITATGTAALYLGPSSSFGGAVTATAPDIWAQGAVYNSPVVFTKTGGSSNHNQQQQNIFNGTLAINQQSSTGYFMLGYNSNDLFNDNITVTSTGTGGIYLGWQSGTGTPTLAAGKTVSIGAAGFSSGFLQFNTFTQLGNAPVNLTFTGTNTAVYFARNSVFGGDVTVTAPDTYLNGSTFSGAFNLTKTGSGGDYSQGGDIFNGISTFTNNSAGFLLLGNNNPDTWNDDAYFVDNGSERVLPAWNSAGNQFNGNIYVTTTGSGKGIQFCGNNTATANLAAGKTIMAGSGGLNAGFLIIRQFTQAGNAPMNLVLSSTASYLQFGPGSAIGGNVATSSPSLFFNGCTFSGTVTSTKNGPSNDGSSGNNIFNGVTILTDSGSGYLLMGNGNPDLFNAAATFNNAGSSNLYVAHNSSGNVFNGPATFNNSPATNTTILINSYSAGTVFNNNIIVTSTSGNGIQFCTGNTTASATLSTGYTISVGAAGFTSGQLLLRQFTQQGSTPQTLSLTGTGSMIFGPSSSFDGSIVTTSPTLFLNGCIFNGASNFTKTGTTGDYSAGGNVFNDLCSITNSGSSYLLLGNSNPDIWNGDVTFTDNGSERLLPCWATAGNQFNGNIYVNTGGSAQGIQFCGGNNTSTALMAAGKTIQSGTGGLNSGYLILKQFTQAGNTPVNLTLNSTATYLQYGPSSALGGNVVSTSPGLYFNGCTFGGTLTATKTGATNDNSSGNNNFDGTTNITDAGAGYLLLGNGNQDQFFAAATFNNTGSSTIYVAYNSPNNLFGGITTFNNTPTANTSIQVSTYSVGTTFSNGIVVTSTVGQGVQFCTGNSTATATLSAGNTISVGPGGFSAGTLYLKQFTQSGPTVQSLTLTGTGNLTFGPSSNMGGNITTTSAALYFNGCVFGGTVTSLKTGTSSDYSTGNNTFNGAFVVTNTGNGYLLMGGNNPDIWQSTAIFNNQSPANHLYVAYNSTGNIFNGDVTFNNQPGNTGAWIYANTYGTNTQYNGNIFVNNIGGAGVYFANASGNATLSGGSLSVGSNGFTSGGLILKNFAQVGGTAQNITTTGTSNITFGSASSFSGPITSSSPGLIFSNSTFNGTVNSTKTGTSSDQSPGNNVFNAASTFTNNGTGYLMMSNSGPDAYNADVTFVKNGSGSVYPNYNFTNTYAGNVTVNSPSSAITFGSGSGTAVFSGSANQNINAVAGSPTPVFTRLVINNTGGGVTLNNTPINVSSSLTMSSGLLNTTATYILTMMNGSTTAAGTALSTSYVNGPMRYQKNSSGTSTLNFPVGNAPDCRPIILTVTHTNGNMYYYTVTLYNASALALHYAYPPTVQTVSWMHYYTIGRTNSAGTNTPATDLSGNQTIQIFFGANDNVTDGSTLTIVKNTYVAPTAWIDIGGVGAPAYSGGANLIGSITSTSAPSAFNSFSTFSLANKFGGINTLPTELLYFDAKPDNSQVDLTWATAMEMNNSYFTVERSRDGISFDSIARINTLAPGGNSNLKLDYSAFDLTPLSGASFYRLKQTDLDGNTKYSGVVTVNFTQRTPIAVYPNPSTGRVYVSGLPSDGSVVNVAWYDLSGKLLIQQIGTPQGGMLTLNTYFHNGDYILKLTSTDGSTTTRTVIIMK